MTRKVLLALALLALQQAALAVDCTVTEHRTLPEDGDGMTMQIPFFPPLTPPQIVTFTSKEATPNAFTSGTYYIGFICTATSYWAVGAENAAVALITNPGLYIPADTWFFIRVAPRQEIAFWDGSTP